MLTTVVSRATISCAVARTARIHHRCPGVPLIEGLAAAPRDRQAGTSITDAVVGALEASMYGSDLLDDELAAHVATTFAAMVKQTPALHAHWLEIQDRLARVAAEQLALQAGTE